MNGFVLGVLTMSLFAWLSLCALDSGKEVLSVILGGPICWAALACCDSYRFIRKKNRRYKYKAALLDQNGGPCYCRSDYADYLIEVGYSFNNYLRSKYNIEDGWNKEDCSFQCVNVRYTPRKVVKAENMYKVPKEVLKKAKQNWVDNGF